MLDDPEAEKAQRALFAVFLTAAILLHAAFGFALGLLEPSAALAVAPPLPPVEFTPIEPAPEVVEEAPPERVAEAPPEPPAPEPVRRAQAAPPAEAPDPAPPPPAETVLDLSGLTLTGGSSSFAMQSGDGTESERIGRPGARVTGRSSEGVEGGSEGGTGATPRPVPVSDLRQPPRVPPNLNDILQDRYPREAHSQQVEAVVSARVVILADGRPASIRITRESVEGYGFGAACRRALQEAGRWSAPIGPDGQPTATSIPFRCEFTVRR